MVTEVLIKGREREKVSNLLGEGEGEDEGDGEGKEKYKMSGKGKGEKMNACVGEVEGNGKK